MYSWRSILSFRVPDRKLIGHYNEYEYWIDDIDTGEELHRAGNSPYSSDDIVPLDEGVGLDVMKDFCEQTGQDLAEDLDAWFLGCEYEEPDDDIETYGSIKSLSFWVPGIGETVMFTRDEDILNEWEIDPDVAGTEGVVYDAFGAGIDGFGQDYTIVVRDYKGYLWQIGAQHRDVDSGMVDVIQPVRQL